MAGGRREIAGGLIAPRAVERIFRDGHQLDMRVAHLLDVRDELVGHFAIAQPALAMLRVRDSLPRTQVGFVDGHWGIKALSLAPAGHPLAIAPTVALQI